MTRAALFLATAGAAVLSACSPPADAPAKATEPAAAPAPAVPAADVAAPAVDPALDAWVRDQVKDGGMPLRYAAAAGPDGLNLVYLTGGDYCGSGGCVLLAARKTDAGFERIGRLTVVRAPIRVLDSRSHGLPDLAVGVAGGGATPHEALIPFDGTRYASNPTVAPARPIEGAAPGQTLITDDTPKVTVRE
ncbi:hypothetical protein [Brevundimonas goettingensis]|uniref:Lipoprotein n=1 Tax=Brevundimonas goettingensis TaxID=2774190 RepID=A0A975GWY1_9CAUL|nr:hypothetical protein [Brevundimonas goettingensis]QTC93087.1 hypothetical protein IFJ75_09725 [Brevundimonas goettingensis]